MMSLGPRDSSLCSSVLSERLSLCRSFPMSADHLDRRDLPCVLKSEGIKLSEFTALARLNVELLAYIEDKRKVKFELFSDRPEQSIWPVT